MDCFSILGYALAISAWLTTMKYYHVSILDQIIQNEKKSLFMLSITCAIGTIDRMCIDFVYTSLIEHLIAPEHIDGPYGKYQIQGKPHIYLAFVSKTFYFIVSLVTTFMHCKHTHYHVRYKTHCMAI